MRIARARDEVSLSPWLGAAARVADVVECVRFGRIPLSDRSPPSLTPRSRTRGRLCFTSRPFSWSSCSEAKQRLRQDAPLRQPRACKARSHRTNLFPRRLAAAIKERRRCQNRRRCSWWVAGSLAWRCHGVAGAPCRELARRARGRTVPVVADVHRRSVAFGAACGVSRGFSCRCVGVVRAGARESVRR